MQVYHQYYCSTNFLIFQYRIKIFSIIHKTPCISCKIAYAERCFSLFCLLHSNKYTEILYVTKRYSKQTFAKLHHPASFTLSISSCTSLRRSSKFGTVNSFAQFFSCLSSQFLSPLSVNKNSHQALLPDGLILNIILIYDQK